MGLLDELKKLTKPYDDEDYLEENLAEPVRVGAQATANRGYAAYAEPPRAAEGAAPAARRPYVFSQRSAQTQGAQQTYAQPNAYDNGYSQPAYSDGYAQQGYASGVTYALGGTVKRVSGNTFIITPSGMDFAGDAYEEPQSSGSYF